MGEAANKRTKNCRRNKKNASAHCAAAGIFVLPKEAIYIRGIKERVLYKKVFITCLQTNNNMVFLKKQVVLIAEQKRPCF